MCKVPTSNASICTPHVVVSASSKPQALAAVASEAATTTASKLRVAWGSSKR
jgi:hypothetical protein